MVVVVLSLGCARQAAPIVIHGKPASYWLEQRRSPDRKTRQKAVASLGLAAKADPAALAAVIDSVKDPDAAVRDVAVLGLLRIGRYSAEAVEVLRRAQTDIDPLVREHATKALQRIEGGR
jgi:HEAT repeat protein